MTLPFFIYAPHGFSLLHGGDNGGDYISEQKIRDLEFYLSPYYYCGGGGRIWTYDLRVTSPKNKYKYPLAIYLNLLKACGE